MHIQSGLRSRNPGEQTSRFHIAPTLGADFENPPLHRSNVTTQADRLLSELRHNRCFANRFLFI